MADVTLLCIAPARTVRGPGEAASAAWPRGSPGRVLRTMPGSERGTAGPGYGNWNWVNPTLRKGAWTGSGVPPSSETRRKRSAPHGSSG